MPLQERRLLSTSPRSAQVVTIAMPVHPFLSAAFAEANRSYPGLQEKWIKISFRVGSRLPRSLLLASLQRAGQVDVIVRSLEDEAAATIPNPPADILLPHWLTMFSAYWIADIYDSCFLLERRGLEPEPSFKSIFADIDLARIDLHQAWSS